MIGANIEIGLTERWMVQNVGRVCTEVKGHALPDWEHLVDGRIHNVYARSVDTVAVHIAKRTGNWRIIGAGIEPSVNAFEIARFRVSDLIGEPCEATSGR